MIRVVMSSEEAVDEIQGHAKELRNTNQSSKRYSCQKIGPNGDKTDREPEKQFPS